MLFYFPHVNHSNATLCRLFHSIPPLQSYTVTLRGRRIPLTGKDLCLKDVKSAACASSPNLSPSDLKCLCNGEALEGDDEQLCDLGVEDNAVVNVVPNKTKKKKVSHPKLGLCVKRWFLPTYHRT